MNRPPPNFPLDLAANLAQNRSSVITVSWLASTRVISHIADPLRKETILFVTFLAFRVILRYVFVFYGCTFSTTFFSLDAYCLFYNSARSMGKKYHSAGVTIRFLLLLLGYSCDRSSLWFGIRVCTVSPWRLSGTSLSMRNGAIPATSWSILHNIY